MKTIKIKAPGGLAAILAELEEGGLRPGEFTACGAFEEHKAAGGKRTLDSIRFALRRMEGKGKLQSRKILMDAKWTRAYSAK